MHRYDEVDATLQALFIAANVIIFAGYFMVPFVFLRFIRLDRATLLVGAGFFALCGITHVGMAFGHSHIRINVWWTLEHLLQAACTWGFILLFGRLLHRADQRRRQRRLVPVEWSAGENPTGPGS